MLYETYQKKINRIANLLAKLLRMLPFIIAGLVAVLLALTVVLSIKGTVTGFQCEVKELTYGSLPECSAKAFLSDVRYEFRKISDVEWNDGLPKLPGTYSVRAVGKTVFGNDRYSKEETIVILQKTLSVFSETEMEYGDIPKIIAEGLVGQDRIVCEEFVCTPVDGDDFTNSDSILALKVEPDLDSISIFDENGDDITSAYIIQLQKKTVSVKKRHLSIEILDQSKIYDGTPFSSEEYQITDGSLLPGDQLIFEFTASLTEAGEVENLPSLRIMNEEQEDVTAFYSVDVKAGKLTVEKRPVFITTGTVSGIFYSDKEISFPEFTIDPLNAPIHGHNIVLESYSKPINVGTHTNTMQFRIEDAQGNDVTENYALTVTEGTITILPLPLRVTTESVTYGYVGAPIYTTEAYTLSGTLLSGHYHQLSKTFSYENAGAYENKVLVSILNAAGEDVTANYKITYDYGTFTIEKIRITIITSSKEWVYDGEEHGYTEIEVIGENGWNANGKYKVFPYNTTRVKYVSVNENRCLVQVIRTENGDSNVTENFDITYQYGTLMVTARPLVIQTGSAEWIYDGEEHSHSEYVFLNGTTLAPGDAIAIYEATVLKNVGKEDNVFAHFEIESKDKERVLSQYQITWDHGTVEIEPRPISIKPMNLEKIYDAIPLYDPFWEYVGSSLHLVDGHQLMLECEGSQTDAGTSASKIVRSSIVIMDGTEDVTYNYLVTTEDSTLTVHPRPIKIKPVDEEKVYDGLPLYPQNWEYTEKSRYAILDIHQLVVEYKGSRTDVGMSYSSITSARIMQGSVDVTHNYEIECFQGCLTVLRRRIEIKPVDEEKNYDGLPLYPQNWEYTENSKYFLVDGHSLNATYEGQQTLPGMSESMILNVSIQNGRENVIANYEILLIHGTLTVYSNGSGEGSGDGGDTGGGGINGETNESQKVGSIKSSVSHTIYLRETSYIYYNGQTRISAPSYPKKLPGGYTYDYLTSLAIEAAGMNAYTAEFQDMLLYMLPYYRGEGNYPSFDSDSNYGSELPSVYDLQYYSVNISEYKKLQGKLPEQYRKYEEEYRQFVYDNYLYLDADTKDYMERLIADQGFSLSDPNVIMKIASYIQQAAVYNLDYDRALDYESNMAVAFLESYKEGLCRHYAASATFLYRALGIPARYTVGFMLETSADEYVDILNGRLGHGHAWVEVYLDGIGWMQVEVTGSDNSGENGGNDSEEEQFIIEIQPEYQYKKYDGTPLFAENLITGNLSDLLAQGYTYQVSVSGSQTEIGMGESKIDSFILFDPTGKDVTDEFVIKYYTGVLEILPPDIVVIPVYLYQLQKYYDGKSLGFEEGDFEFIELPEGVTVKLELNISLTEVGQLTLSDLNRNFENYAWFQVYETATMKDVTSWYRIIFQPFDEMDFYIPIKVEPRNITVTAESQTKQYDGEPLENGNAFISFGSLVKGHRIEYVTMGSITAPGITFNKVVSVIIYDENGNDVTQNYNIFGEPGILTVIEPD